MTRLKIETEFRLRDSLSVFCYSAYNCSLFQTILRLFCYRLLNYSIFLSQLINSKSKP